MPRFVAGLALLLFAGTAHAASFDCTKARMPDERTVCHYRLLNDRDVRMATLYGLDLRLVPMGSRDAIKDDQVVWLAKRRACRSDFTCLADVYDKRIATLRAVIETRVYPHGPF
jgi:uncharacterized protein